MHKTRHSRMLIMTLKGLFWVNVKLFYTRETFHPSIFFFKCYFKSPCFQLQQNVLWTDQMTRVIIASTGINGVSLAHHISWTNIVSCLSSCLFRNKHYALSEYLWCASPMSKKGSKKWSKIVQRIIQSTFTLCLIRNNDSDQVQWYQLVL